MTPIKAGTQFSDPWGCKAELSQLAWLHIWRASVSKVRAVPRAVLYMYVSCDLIRSWTKHLDLHTLQCGPWLHYCVDLWIQTYTEPVSLKYRKLATKYLWIYGCILVCSQVTGVVGSTRGNNPVPLLQRSFNIMHDIMSWREVTLSTVHVQLWTRATDWKTFCLPWDVDFDVSYWWFLRTVFTVHVRFIVVIICV